MSWSLAVGCGACFFCRENLPQKCEHLYKYGHQRWEPPHPPIGGLSDFVVLVPGTPCYSIPEGVADHAAASANCSTATAAALLRRAGESAGRSVLVLGAGILGLTVCAMARAAGAQTVMVSVPVAECRERGLRFGATHAFGADDELMAKVLEVTSERGADVVLELAGTAASVRSALMTARTGGTIVLAGTVAPVGDIPLDPEQVVRRMLTIHGVHNYHPCDLASALKFLAGDGQVFPWRELNVAEFSLEDAEQAFATAHAQLGVRVAVVPSLQREQP